MKFKEFESKLQKSYHKYFTDSKIIIENNYLGKGFNISCYLINNIDEAINKIINNDMFSISFEITTSDANSMLKPKITSLEEMPENLVLNVWRNYYTTKPQNKYCVYSNSYLPFRKQKGTPEKLLNILDEYFAILNKALKEELNNNNIHDNYIAILKEKLI